jgi:hypothetical protein
MKNTFKALVAMCAMSVANGVGASVIFAEFDAVPFNPSRTFVGSCCVVRSLSNFSSGIIGDISFNASITDNSTLDVGFSDATVADNSGLLSSRWDVPEFTPQQDNLDYLVLTMITGTFGPAERVTFDFDIAITNPTFHLDNFGPILYDFSSTTGLTSLERLSGETDFGVGASQVFDSDGWNVNGRTKGSVLLKGTFESISFDVFKANAESDGDGSGLQISVEVPEPTTIALLALGLFGVGAAARRRPFN